MSGSNRVHPAILGGVAALMALALCAQAWAWPWNKEADLPPEIKLEDVMKSPSVFLQREVRFTCRFALQGKLFKHFHTRFNPNEHANFAVWPMEAELWDKAQRRNVLPTLYIDKSDRDLFRVLQQLERYDRVEITGRVVSTYAGLPWIFVSAIAEKPEMIEVNGQQVELVLTESTIVHVRNGLALLEQENPALAARHFELALAQGVPPEYLPEVRRNLALAYAKTDRPARSFPLFEEALELDPDNAELHLEYARALLEHGDPRLALEHARKTVALSPEYPEAYAIMGEAYGKLGQIEEALEQTRLAATVPGISPRERAMADVHRARILVVAQRYADAVRAYAAAISEGSVLAGAPWLRKEIGQLYESRFDATGNVALLEEAEREYANANVLSNNRDVEGLFLAARAAFKRARVEGAGYEKAEELLKQALQLDPTHVPSLLLKGEIAMARGDTAEAERIFTELAALDGVGADALSKLATVYETGDNAERALEIYERILQSDPQNAVVLARYAELAERAGRSDAALRAYETLMNVSGSDTSYAMKLGRLRLQAGDYAGAVQAFERVVTSSSPMAMEAAVQQARALVLSGNPAGAEQVLRSALSRTSDGAILRVALARLLADQARNLGQATDLGAKAVEAMPQDLDALDAYAWALAQNSRPEEALKIYQGMPTDQMTRAALYHQAVALYYAHQFEQAQTVAEQVSAMAQTPSEISGEVALLQDMARKLVQMIEQARQQAQAAAGEALDLAEEARNLQEQVTAAEAAEVTVEAIESTDAVAEPDESSDAVAPVTETADSAAQGPLVDAASVVETEEEAKKRVQEMERRRAQAQELARTAQALRRKAEELAAAAAEIEARTGKKLAPVATEIPSLPESAIPGQPQKDEPAEALKPSSEFVEVPGVVLPGRQEEISSFTGKAGQENAFRVETAEKNTVSEADMQATILQEIGGAVELPALPALPELPADEKPAQDAVEAIPSLPAASTDWTGVEMTPVPDMKAPTVVVPVPEEKVEKVQKPAAPVADLPLPPMMMPTETRSAAPVAPAVRVERRKSVAPAPVMTPAPVPAPAAPAAPAPAPAADLGDLPDWAM